MFGFLFVKISYKLVDLMGDIYHWVQITVRLDGWEGPSQDWLDPCHVYNQSLQSYCNQVNTSLQTYTVLINQI